MPGEPLGSHPAATAASEELPSKLQVAAVLGQGSPLGSQAGKQLSGQQQLPGATVLPKTSASAWCLQTPRGRAKPPAAASCLSGCVAHGKHPLLPAASTRSPSARATLLPHTHTGTAPLHTPGPVVPAHHSRSLTPSTESCVLKQASCSAEMFLAEQMGSFADQMLVLIAEGSSNTWETEQQGRQLPCRGSHRLGWSQQGRGAAVPALTALPTQTHGGRQ